MTVIDKGSWPRRAHYDFFAPMSHPFYALTFPVDVTPLRALCKERGLSFYTAMVFAVIKAMEQVDAFAAAGKTLCAICAAPSILGNRGLLKGKKAIAYPGFEEELTGADVTYEPAVRDENIITGRGMGCAIDFGLMILEYLEDKPASDAMAEKIIYKR